MRMPPEAMIDESEAIPVGAAECHLRRRRSLVRRRAGKPGAAGIFGRKLRDTAKSRNFLSPYSLPNS